MSTLVRADPVLGRHLFRADAHGPTQHWSRETRLEAALRDAFVAVEPWLRFEELTVTLGTTDEYGTAEPGDVVQPPSPDRWPTVPAVEATGVVGAIRIAVPRTAHLGGTIQFACESGFVRRAAVAPAEPLGEADTVWLEGSAMMEVRLRGRIDGQAHLKLQLGTSLHGAADARDPTIVVDGASLAEWRTATRSVVAAMAQALMAAGFLPDA